MELACAVDVRGWSEERSMGDDDKLRVILIVSAIVAALAVHRFDFPTQAAATDVKVPDSRLAPYIH